MSLFDKRSFRLLQKTEANEQKIPEDDKLPIYSTPTVVLSLNKPTSSMKVQVSLINRFPMPEECQRLWAWVSSIYFKERRYQGCYMWYEKTINL